MFRHLRRSLCVHLSQFFFIWLLQANCQIHALHHIEAVSRWSFPASADVWKKGTQLKFSAQASSCGWAEGATVQQFGGAYRCRVSVRATTAALCDSLSLLLCRCVQCKVGCWWSIRHFIAIVKLRTAQVAFYRTAGREDGGSFSFWVI